MRKLITMLLGLLMLLNLAACADAPAQKPVADQETQRGHAHEAQDELSTEVHR